MLYLYHEKKVKSLTSKTDKMKTIKIITLLVASLLMTVVARSQSAGPDQNACLYSSIQTAATGTGIWVIPASNPAPAMMPSFTDSVTYIGGFTAIGDYAFIWHTATGDDTMIVSIRNAPTLTFSNTISSTSAEAIATVTSSSTTGPGGGNVGYWSDYVYYVINDTTFGLHVTNSGVYTFIATDSFGCRTYASDTVTVPFCHLIGSLIGYSSATNDTFVSHIYGANGPVHFAWQSAQGFTVDTSIYITNHYPYPAACLTVTDSLGCSISICDTLVGSADLVWPGDADANHLVDNTDLLPIGLGYGSTGPIRAYDSNVWQGDSATDWASSFSTYPYVVNYKHADCDGNGTINADDTLAILQNFGQVHNKKAAPAPWRSGLAALTISFSSDTVLDGDTLTADIALGDAVLPANDIYGIAFTYNFDPIVTVPSSLQFGFSSSWLGTNANSISIHKDFPAAGIVKAAITGIDHLNRSGAGVIAHVRTIITTDNINGKDLSYYANKAFISDVMAVDEQGNVIGINEGIDSNFVGYNPTGIIDPSSAHMIKVYPNPSAGRIELQASDDISAVEVSDVIGQTVYQQSGMRGRHQSIDLSGLGTGVYILRITTGDTIQTVRLTIAKQ